MKKCPSCNKDVESKAKFCSFCGEKLTKSKKAKESEPQKEKGKDSSEIFNKISDNIEKILETEDTSKDYKKEDIESYKGLAILSYLGPLALVPYLKGKDYKYSYYHAVQGMNLLLVWVAYTILAILFYQIKVTKSCDYIWGRIGNCITTTPWWIKLPFGIIGFALFALNIIGIVYALLGKAKKLPLVDKINIIK